MESVKHESNTERNISKTRGLEQKFLDLFWKLAEDDPEVRLTASLNIIKHLESQSTESSQLTYTICRLVKGLASTRKCARHGYFITLIGILKVFTSLDDAAVKETIDKNLVVEGGKKERVDQAVGRLLAYGAMLRSGRLNQPEDVAEVVQQFITSSKMKSYLPPIAFGFLVELVLLVDISTFKSSVWPILKSEVSMPLEQQTCDTLNLLLTVKKRFPKMVKNSLMKEVLGANDFGDSECFTSLTKFLLENGTIGNHPVLMKIVNDLKDSGKIVEFWTKNVDPVLDCNNSPTRGKVLTAFRLLMRFSEVVDDHMVSHFLSENFLTVLVSSLQAKQDPVMFNAAEELLDLLKELLVKDDVSPDVQKAIIQKMLKNPDHVAFDKITGTRFMASIIGALKKETIIGIVDILHNFVEGNAQNQEKTSVLQYLVKLINHSTMTRELNWKASQLIYLVRWAYFTPSCSKNAAKNFKEVFYRALDRPCKKLEDLSSVLSIVFEEVTSLLSKSDFSDQVKTTWKTLTTNIRLIQKNRQNAKQDDVWLGQVFLVLYFHMGFELLRDVALPSEIIAELSECYTKATEKKKKTKKKDNVEDKDPHWLGVVTDILLSFLSRDQHLLRSVVVSVWSLLAEHITMDALQQVLDVIDPSKGETPLADEDEEDLSEIDSGEEESEEDENEASATEESEVDKADESDEVDEEETVTDKLRMRIREALGDSAALTDTESIDPDDLSDGQMESLDKALGSAFREFRKIRPVRKNGKKLPKDQTSLMHFRIRVLDLIDVLADKEISVTLATAPLIPLLSLLEVTVKEPLQAPLIQRARNVLEKLTNIRKCSEVVEDGGIDGLVGLLRQLFCKAYTNRTVMQYISDDLVRCCSFVLRCTLNISRTANQTSNGLTNGEQPHVQMPSVLGVYLSHLTKFFKKRESPIPLSIFSRAIVFPWPDAVFLLDPLIEYAFDASSLRSRRTQAVELLTLLFHNSTVLSSVRQQFLMQRVEALLKHSERILRATSSDVKPKYLVLLFGLLRVVFLCPALAEAEGLSKLWEPVKDALANFTSGEKGKLKDVRKSHSMLTKCMGVQPNSQSEPRSTRQLPAKQLPTGGDHLNGNGSATEVKELSQVSSSKNKTKKKVNNSKQTGGKERKETKKRRLAATEEGFTDMVSFSQVDIDADEAPEATISFTETESVDAKQRKKSKRGKHSDVVTASDGAATAAAVESAACTNAKRKDKSNHSTSPAVAEVPAKKPRRVV